jgi:Transglycosylase SLT domain
VRAFRFEAAGITPVSHRRSVSDARLGGLRALLLGGLVLTAAGPAAAQVLDIDEHGTVVVFNGPAQHLSPDIRDARPISPAAGRPGRRRSGQGKATAAGATPRREVVAAIDDAAQRQGIASGLLTAVARTESGLDNRAVSPKGARGVMQLMPGTARALGVDPADTADNVHGGAAYLRQLLQRYDGDIVKALAAYNAGPGAVDRHNGVPRIAETQDYVSKVLEHMADSVVPSASASTVPSVRQAVDPSPVRGDRHCQRLSPSQRPPRTCS